MNDPRYKNGNRRRKIRARLKAMGLPCAICGRPIHYDEPSDSKHPLSFVIDEILPVGRHKEWGYENKTAAALDWNNVQPAHYICNARKGMKTMTELYNLELRGGSADNTCKKATRWVQSAISSINLPDGDW